MTALIAIIMTIILIKLIRMAVIDILNVKATAITNRLMIMR